MKTETNEAVKNPTKMDIARELFKTVNARGYALNGDAQRSAFAKLAADRGLSKHCANTYYQNLSNQARGQALYKYNKKSVKQAEAQVMNDLGKHRWMTVNEAGEEVNSFPSRAVAQQSAKEGNMKWADRTKVA